MFPIVMSILSSYNMFAIHLRISVQLLLNYFIVYKKNWHYSTVLPVLLQTWSSSSDIFSKKRPPPIVILYQTRQPHHESTSRHEALGQRRTTNMFITILNTKLLVYSVWVYCAIKRIINPPFYGHTLRSPNKNFVTVKERWLAKRKLIITCSSWIFRQMFWF